MIKMSVTVTACMEAFLRHKEALDDVEREGREATSEESYNFEFNRIREISQAYKTDNIYPSTEGEKSMNAPKNRYKDIIPYDHTRVTIHRDTQKSPGADYINASYIKGAIGDQMYIAAQGPLPKTVNDFWQMIWENETRVIMMACREYEGEPIPKLKCQRYWMNNCDEEMTFGDIKVTMEREETTDYTEHVIRHLVATRGDTSRKIVHLHYKEWPDRGRAKCIPSTLHLIEKMRMIQSLDAKETPPVLVHCSAGCGRTGTILVIDFVWSLLKYGKLTEDFKLFDVILEMRKQRMAIVQSPEQYVFVHDAVAELFRQQMDLIDDHLYDNVTKVSLPGQQRQTLVSSEPVYDEAKSAYISSESTSPKRPPLQKPATMPRTSSSSSSSSSAAALECEYAFPMHTKTSASEPVYEQAKSMHASPLASKRPAGQRPLPAPRSLSTTESEYAFASQSRDSTPKLPERNYSPEEAVVTSSPKFPPPTPTMPKPRLSETNAETKDVKKEVKHADSHYAYADPYQTGKWSMQEIARGNAKPLKVKEDQYSEIESPYQEIKSPTTTGNGIYAEINVREEVAHPNVAQPTIPLPMKPKPTIPTTPFVIPKVIFKGYDISFPNRVPKPVGKRQMKVVVF